MSDTSDPLGSTEMTSLDRRVRLYRVARRDPDFVRTEILPVAAGTLRALVSSSPTARKALDRIDALVDARLEDLEAES